MQCTTKIYAGFKTKKHSVNENILTVLLQLYLTETRNVYEPV